MKRLAAAVASVVMALAGACAASDGAAPEATASSQTAPSSTTTTLPPVSRYALLPGEPVPEVKELAVRVLEALGNYDEGAGGPVAARERLAALAVDPVVADQAGPLVAGGASRLEVVYPQLGGLTDDAASVMAVVRHRSFAAGVETLTTRTVDVRLARRGETWSVTGIASTGGEPPPAPAPSAVGQTVLANERIEFADSARWDIEAGRIDDAILEVLQRVAERHRLSVTVLATGHPNEVFGGTSVSNHTEGRGVDIWAVDGTPVVMDQAVDGPIYALVEQVLADGVTEVGSPWDLDGAGRGASFTNTVHLDHLHFAFDRTV